jgi:16S rRNA (uracil1498-N3)-methyltransferase
VDRGVVPAAVTRAPIAGLAAGEHRLGGPLGHYLGRVLRLRAGSAFVAFDPARGLEADARVVRAEGDAVTVDVGPLRPASAPPERALVFIQGFAKADKVDAVVRDATELGATRIVVATTARSVVKVDASRGEARAQRWTRIAEEAARQCGRSEAPRVDPPVPWEEALGGVDAASARFCLYEEASDPLGPELFAALGGGRALAFACGPEGGLTPDEIACARAAGWAIASLGPLVLRTETVAAAVLGAVRVASASGRPAR